MWLRTFFNSPFAPSGITFTEPYGMHVVCLPTPPCLELLICALRGYQTVSVAVSAYSGGLHV